MMKIRATLSRYGMHVVLVLLIAFFSLASDSFLTQQNIVNVLRQFSMLGISAVGMTMVILTAGIDLSVGSNMGLTGVIAAICMINFQMNWVLAGIVALFVAMMLGLINGLAVTKFKVPPLITTLATLTSARGLAYILTADCRSSASQNPSMYSVVE
jgi:ribose transport system permease protein